MAKSAKARVSPAPEPELSPDELVAKRAFDAWVKLQSPEFAWIKQFEKDKVHLKQMVKDGRNAPWEGKGWRVRFDRRKGKPKPTCGAGGCLNAGQFQQDELWFAAQLMQEPPSAA